MTLADSGVRRRAGLAKGMGSDVGAELASAPTGRRCRRNSGAGKLLPYSRVSRVVLFTVVAALAVRARAQQAPAHDEVDETVAQPAADARVDEEITVSARAAESPAAAVTVLDADAIEREQARDASELVRSAAGVHLLSAGPRGGAAHAFTRGGDANFTLVLLDGIPLNDVTDVQGGAFNLSTMGADDLEAIEILRGPHSYFFGSSAVAGAINLVTRDGGGGRDGRLRLEAGGNSLLRAGVSLAGPASSGGDGGDFYMSASHDEEEGAVADDAFEQSTLHGAAGFELGETASIRIIGRLTDLEIDDYPEGSGGPVFGSGELRRTEGRQLSFGAHLSAGGSGWRHGASASANRAESDLTSPAVLPVVPASVEDRTYTRAQAAWIASRDLDARTELSIGAQIDHEDGENSSALLLPPFLGGGEISGDYRLDRTTPGVFASGTFDARGLVVEGGVRADDPEELGVEWSPRLGVRWQIADSDWHLRSAWSRAFKLPSFFALASPPALGGNPDLLPETSVGFDAGLGLERGSTRFGVTVFSNTYRDLIDFDFETFTHVNRSRVEAEGAELEAGWQPVTRLRLSTAWTLQDVGGTSAANVVLHSPEWFGNVGLEWSVVDSVRLRAEARFAGETADVQIPIGDAARVAGHEVVDLAASWQAAERFTVRGRVDNVLDEEYEQFLGFPQPGRTAGVGIHYDFR